MRKLVLIATMVMLVSYTNVQRPVPFTVEGIVQDKASGQPLKSVHVFTEKGEEEAVSDEKGSFRFQSWKETVVVTAEVSGYQRKQLNLVLPSPKQIILLQKE